MLYSSSMANEQVTILGYCVTIKPDERTGTDALCYTAYCSTLDVVDDGNTHEDAKKNIQGAIEAHLESRDEHDTSQSPQIIIRKHNQPISKGVLKILLRQMNLSLDEFLKLL